MPTARPIPRHRLAPIGIVALFLFFLLFLSRPALANADVPYLPTHHDAVHRMLEMADAGPGDRVFDLGSGDGRIVIQAVRDWDVAEATGIELDPALIQQAEQAARKAGVERRTRFLQADLFTSDFSDATIVTMYLLESLNLRLKPVLLDALKPGTRLVSHVFRMGDWAPDATVVARGIPSHLWIVPAKVDGLWHIEIENGQTFTVNLEQRFQDIDGSYVKDGIDMGLSFAALRGSEIRFSAHGMHFIGDVQGDTIHALPGRGTVPAWSAARLEAGKPSRP